MTDDDRLLGDSGDSFPAPATYALSAVVYAERGDEILLIKRAEGSALAGQFFLPGGLVEPDELPEDGARRELTEEAGIEIDSELELVGCYPIHVYGYDMLQLSYRGAVAENSAVVISHEHDDAQWVKETSTATCVASVVTDRARSRASAGAEQLADPVARRGRLNGLALGVGVRRSRAVLQKQDDDLALLVFGRGCSRRTSSRVLYRQVEWRRTALVLQERIRTVVEKGTYCGRATRGYRSVQGRDATVVDGIRVGAH